MGTKLVQANRKTKIRFEFFQDALYFKAGHVDSHQNICMEKIEAQGDCMQREPGMAPTLSVL